MGINMNALIIVLILIIIAAVIQYKISDKNKIGSVIILVIGFFISIVSGKIFYNEPIPDNQDNDDYIEKNTTQGQIKKIEISTESYYNLSANIINGGFVCEDELYFYLGNDGLRKISKTTGSVDYLYNDKVYNDVYYINLIGEDLYFIATDTSDMHDYKSIICKIKKDGTDYEQLYSSYCYELTYYDDWLYFCSKINNDSYGICRMKSDSSHFEMLTECREWYMTIYNDKIFFCNYSDDNTRSIYSMNLDGTDLKLLKEGQCYDLCIVNNVIYFSSGSNSRHLYSIDINGENEKHLLNTFSKHINSYNDNLFFVDSSGNICSYNLNTKESRHVHSLGYDCYINIVNSDIYYINENDNIEHLKIKIS